MKIVHSWLNELAALGDDVELIAANMTDLGLAVDDEAFDLVEDRHVGGVGRVSTEHLARHHHVDRRGNALHHPDLHR